MDIIKVFGTNVRKFRTKMGVSQEKLAELCGLHRTYISDIECFRRSISLDNIQKIADALKIETHLFRRKSAFSNRIFCVLPSLSVKQKK